MISCGYEVPQVTSYDCICEELRHATTTERCDVHPYGEAYTYQVIEADITRAVSTIAPSNLGWKSAEPFRNRWCRKVVSAIERRADFKKRTSAEWVEFNRGYQRNREWLRYRFWRKRSVINIKIIPSYCINMGEHQNVYNSMARKVTKDFRKNKRKKWIKKCLA